MGGVEGRTSEAAGNSTNFHEVASEDEHLCLRSASPLRGGFVRDPPGSQGRVGGARTRTHAHGISSATLSFFGFVNAAIRRDTNQKRKCNLIPLENKYPFFFFKVQQ